MSYIIFNNNNELVKIAANDSDRDSQNIVLSDHTIQNVSDSDFLKIRTGVSTATYDGTSVTLTDNVMPSLSEINVIIIASSFLEENKSNLLYTPINEYKNYLKNFDSSSLSFPSEKNLEQYCNENSLPFYHPLQIP